MLNEKPLWIVAPEKPLTQWYGHVNLLPKHVLGQWLCIDRATGQVKWQQSFFRPNTIAGVDSGVIVASEMRSDGPWTANFGCYGMSLEDGQMLWTSHSTGLWGSLGRLLDFVPGLTNEFRDTPHHVDDGKVFCDSGRVLDVKSGRLVQKVDPEVIWAREKPVSLAMQFYTSGRERTHPGVPIGHGLVLRHAQPAGGLQRGIFEIAAETDAGNPVWRFSIAELGRYIDSNFYSYRLVPPFLYFIVSDEPRSKPHPTKSYYVLPNPTRWHFVTIALSTGEVVQDFSLDDQKLAECRIEDVDDDGLLIGKFNHHLAYYERTN
jgi:hypothetical protein